jgi:hypothetical protein
MEPLGCLFHGIPPLAVTFRPTISELLITPLASWLRKSVIVTPPEPGLGRNQPCQSLHAQPRSVSE